jgi:hypothetical protein
MRAKCVCLTGMLCLIFASSIQADVPKGKGGTYPQRRLLGIFVSQYLYLPTVSYESETAGNARVDFGAMLTFLGRTLRIPESQVYELSDSALGKKRIAPTRETIEQVITQFLDGSGSADSDILLFVGHEVELEGEVYLAPLDGDVKNPQTLIPLSWLFKRLEACPARQKLLIVDLNRFDPVRGMGQASPMSAKIEAALKQPPTGVQVWSACSAGQYSLKLREARKYEGRPLQGGLFQSLLPRTYMPGETPDSSSDGIVPLEAMAQRVNSELALAIPAVGLGRFKQTSFTAGSVAAPGSNGERASRSRTALSYPAWPADAVPIEMTQSILKEIEASTAHDLPGDDVVMDSVIALLPFRKSAMKPYGADAVTDEQIDAHPSDYPIRSAIRRASASLRSHAKDDGLRLISTISSAELNAPKSQAKINLTRLQRAPARRLQVLEEILADLEKASEERGKEKSPRWQAQFDLFRARMLTQYAHIYEYNAVIGMVRKDALPDLDEKNGDKGWRLVNQDTMVSGAEAKESARSASKLYAKIIHDHPDTPWAILARREKAQPLGLTWLPTTDVTPIAAPPKKGR